MMPYKRVVFVDGDATARSVMAAAIMREEPIGTEVEVLARGLVVLFPEPVNQKIEAILANNNLTAKGHEAVQTLIRIHCFWLWKRIRSKRCRNCLRGRNTLPQSADLPGLPEISNRCTAQICPLAENALKSFRDL